MKRVIIKQFLHDGYVFNFTDEAVNSDKGIIGFYFDGLGFPQGIHRNSIFGSYIVGAKNTEQQVQAKVAIEKESPEFVPSMEEIEAVLLAVERLTTDDPDKEDKNNKNSS